MRVVVEKSGQERETQIVLSPKDRRLNLESSGTPRQGINTYRESRCHDDITGVRATSDIIKLPEPTGPFY